MVASRPGLTSAEATQRLAAEGPNILPAAKKANPWLLLSRQMTHFFAAVLWVAAGLALLAGLPPLAVAIAVIVALNGVFAFAQEYRAAERLRTLMPVRAHVIRDGRLTSVDVTALVRGDRVMLAAGDRFGADLELVSCHGLKVDESLLTGESVPVQPAPGDQVWAGTFVVEGEALADVASGRSTVRATTLAEVEIEGAPATPPFPSDAELVAQLRGKDEAAFALMVDAWSDAMLRVARSFVSTNDSAAEVVQDTWLAVIQGIGRFEGRSTLKTWVFRILMNTAKRRGAREIRAVPWSSLFPPDQDDGPTVDPSRFGGPGDPYPGHWREPPAPWPSPEQETLAVEIRAQLSAALELLPIRQQLVITLHDVEGYSSEEVCSILEISAANQRVLLHRARAFVRGRLEEYFETVGEQHGRDGRR